MLLGGAVTTLSVARSLGRAGVAVTILADGYTNCLARRSRFCHRYVHFDSHDGAGVKARWLDWLVSCGEPAVVLPCGDEGVELVARNRSVLVGAGHLPIEAADDVLLTMLDKQRTYQLAAELGVAAPRTVTAHSPDDVAGAAEAGLSYPCAVKPTRSDILMRSLPQYKSAKGTVVHNEAELDAAVRPLVSVGVGALITELIVGGDDRHCSYYSYLDENGEPLLHFTKRKPRQYPIGFGSGTFHVTKWQPDVAAVGLKLFQGLGLRGMGNVEFKRDARDGAIKLVECTPRFTMANELVRLAGIDLALVAYNRLVGRPLPPLGTARDDLYLWFPPQDVRALRAYREAGQLTTGQWLRSLARTPHFPTFQWRDPVPSLVGARGALRQMGRARRAASGRSGAPAAGPPDHVEPAPGR